MVEIGSKAPDFSLKNQFGETVTLNDFFVEYYNQYSDDYLYYIIGAGRG